MFPFEDVLLGEARWYRDGQQTFRFDKETRVFLAKLRSSNRASAKALAMLVTVARLALMYTVSLAVVPSWCRVLPTG